eukprot:362866-Chlamydomonas_euryale.AAC.33
MQLVMQQKTWHPAKGEGKTSHHFSMSWCWCCGEMQWHISLNRDSCWAMSGHPCQLWPRKNRCCTANAVFHCSYHCCDPEPSVMYFQQCSMNVQHFQHCLSGRHGWRLHPSQFNQVWQPVCNRDGRVLGCGVHTWVECLDDGNRGGASRPRRGPVGGCADRDARQND